MKKIEKIDPFERWRYIEGLSKLYSISKDYPSDPALSEYEVIKLKESASGRGGFADCWEGLFLGQHKIAMKGPRVPPTDGGVALRRVSPVASFLSFCVGQGS